MRRPIASRRARPALAALYSAVVVLAQMAPAAWADPAPTGSGTVVVRILDAVTGSPRATITLDRSTYALAAGQMGPPIIVGAGQHDYRISAAGLVATGSSTLADGCTSVVVAGQPGGPHHRLTVAAIPECPIPRITDGEASIRLLLATGSADGPVTMTLGSPEAVLTGPAVTASPFEASTRLDAPAGTTSVTLTRPGRPGVLVTLPESLASDTAYTLLMSGGSALMPVGDRLLVDGAQPPETVPAGTRINTDGPAPRHDRTTPKPGPNPPVAVSLASAAVLVAVLVGVFVATAQRRRRAALLALTMALALVGVACQISPRGARAGAAQPAPLPAGRAPAALSAPAPTVQSPELAGADPARVSFAAGSTLTLAEVHADIVSVAASELANLPTVLPATVVGWVEGSDPPDSMAGTTVLVGHVVYGGKPAVFADLASSTLGDPVELDTPDLTSTYRIDSVASFPKGGLPDWLWDPRPVRTLILVTCGGQVDPATGLHELNVVVTAHLVDASPRAQGGG